MIGFKNRAGLAPKKSRRSQVNNCVTPGINLLGGVVVQDSKEKAGATLSFSSEAWTSFIGAIPTKK